MQTITITSLRGLGRYGYRHGMALHTAIQYAIRTIGRDLTSDERSLVMAGFRAERSEVCCAL
jgi:hypothetical protein